LIREFFSGPDLPATLSPHSQHHLGMNKSDALRAKLEAAQREWEEAEAAEAREEEERKREADEARRLEMEKLEAEAEEASKKMKAAHARRLELMAAEAEAEALATLRKQEAPGKSARPNDTLAVLTISGRGIRGCWNGGRETTRFGAGLGQCRGGRKVQRVSKGEHGLQDQRGVDREVAGGLQERGVEAKPGREGTHGYGLRAVSRGEEAEV
jgi:hypothetical protein